MALFSKLLLVKVKGFVCCSEGKFYFFNQYSFERSYIVLMIWPSFLIGIGGICANFVESSL